MKAINERKYISISLSNSKKTKNTVEFAKYLKSLGCKKAFNLDGGGLVKLLWKLRGTNNITTLRAIKIKGSIRKHSSVMYFTE